MAVVLYYTPMSFYSQKVRLFLEEKEIPHKTVFINLVLGETHTPWFINNINAAGQVPTVQHGDKFLSNSDEIARYLDNTFGAPVLYPSIESEEGKKIRDFLHKVSTIGIEVITYGTAVFPEITQDRLMPSLMTMFSKRRVINKQMTTGIRRQIKDNPSMTEKYERKLPALEKFENECSDKECLLAHIEDLKKLLQHVETTLKRNAEEGHADYFLHGAQFNYADVTFAVLLERLRYVGLYTPVIVTGGKHPYIEKYYDKLLNRQSFRRAVLDGYKLSAFIPRSLLYLLPGIAKRVALVSAIAATGYFIWKYYKENY